MLVIDGLGQGVPYFVASAVTASLMLFVLTRVGLLAAGALFLAQTVDSPPLVFSQWYAGRAIIPLLAPLALLFYGFYISLGSQPVFGKALEE